MPMPCITWERKSNLQIWWKKNLNLERANHSNWNEALTSPNNHFTFPTITLIFLFSFFFFLKPYWKKKKNNKHKPVDDSSWLWVYTELGTCWICTSPCPFGPGWFSVLTLLPVSRISTAELYIRQDCCSSTSLWHTSLPFRPNPKPESWLPLLKQIVYPTRLSSIYFMLAV